jgi:hypothetical protein
MNRFIARAAIAAGATLFAGLGFAGPARAQTVAAISLTNGPPNLSAGLLAARLPSGSPVSDVYADMSPMSAAFTGTFNPPTGANASSFSISTATNCGSAGNIRCGKLVTNGALAAGTYNITLSTSLGGSRAVTVNVVGGTQVACGDQNTLQSAINSAGSGGTLLLAANCTYHISGNVQPSNNQTFVGAGIGSTIIDAGSNSGVRINPSAAATITWASTTFQNFNTPTDATLYGFNGSFIRNNAFINSLRGPYLQIGSSIVNNLFTNLSWTAIESAWDFSASNTINVVGNEFYNNATGVLPADCANFANIKLLGPEVGSPPGPDFVFNYNYVHDNLHFGIWLDTNDAGEHATLTGNTFIRNSNGAFFPEVTSNIDVGFNVFTDNGYGANAPACGAQPQWGAAVSGESGDNWNVHDNNILQTIGVTNEESSFFYFQDGRGNNNTNIIAQNNTITFTSSTGKATMVNASPASGSFFNGNHYYVATGSTSDTHFQWGSFTGNFVGLQGQGQELNGSIHVGNEQANDNVTGCRHVACTGAGIGANGLPLGGSGGGQSIQSVPLSNSTFTPGVANGTVGTVSATMSPATPAFSGSLSVTGTNSGGFHLSGNTLQERASGTPAGTYKDFNIVATQAGISNSPQQISPTVTGVVDAPFGGTARAMTSTIQAEDYDTGGQGVAYNAADVCGFGGSSYRPDAINIATTTDTGGGYKIGCNRPGDYHNYTISVTTTGTYTLNMRVANIETGASYHVAIDGVSVVSGITVPNTGAYDTFTTVTSGHFNLTAGQHVMQIVLDTAGPSGFGGDFNWAQGTLVAASESPFGGTPRSITSTIQAEDYDLGGQGVAYNATNGGSTDGASYRADYINLYKTADAGGGLKIGYLWPGNYYKYTINVATAGLYTLNLRVANNETGASYHVAFDGVTAVSGIAVPNTGGYDTFSTVTSSLFALTTGQHIMQIVLDTAGKTGKGGNFHWGQGVLVPIGGSCTRSITVNAC